MAQISPPQFAAVSAFANLFAIGVLLTANPQLAVAANDAVVHAAKPRLDLSGQNRIGIGSFYADRFAGRKMADGARMNPHGNNAASRTLPLGTVARVTNLKTHRSAIVVIQDRGPYVRGRIVDLSPSTARQIGLTRRMGITRVLVTPIAIPLPDGRLRLASHPVRDWRCARGDCDRYRVALQRQLKKTG